MSEERKVFEEEDGKRSDSELDLKKGKCWESRGEC